MGICSGSTELDALNAARQSYPTTFQANGYIDIIKTEFLIDNHKLHGGRVMPFITSRVTEVDTIEDFEYLQYQLNSNQQIYEKLFK